jgi:diguanylate cyclase (GGDEF)-like protein/PAS domain S-box-containing protein
VSEAPPHPGGHAEPAAGADRSGRRDGAAPARRVLLPVVTAGLVCLASLWLYQRLDADRQELITKRVEWTSARVAGQLTESLDDRISALRRLALRWAAREEPQRDAWNLEADPLLDDFAGLFSVAWVGPDLRVRWSRSRGLPTELDGTDLTAFPDRREPLEAARKLGEPVVTDFLDLLVDHQRGFLIAVPIDPSSRAGGGWILGASRAQPFFDDVLRRYGVLNANLVVLDAEGGEAYRHQLDDQTEIGGHDLVLGRWQLGWTLRTWPSADVLAAARQRLPELALGASLLIGLGLGFVLYLNGLARERLALASSSTFALEREVQARRDAERAVREEKERYRSLLDRNPAGMYRVDLEGRLLDGNQALLAMFGVRSREEMMALSTDDLYFEPAERREWLASLVASGEVRNAEIRYRRRNGTMFWGLESAVLRRDAEAPIIEGAIVDVSESKAAAAERDRFFQLSLDLLAVIDSEGRFLRVNPAWSRTLGFTADELGERHFLDLVHPDDRAAVEAEYLRLLLGGEPLLDFECRFPHRDGHWVWTLWNATGAPDVGRVYAAGRDISARRETESTLRASEERYRQLIDASPGLIATLDLDGRLLSVNPAAGRALGYVPAEVLGRNVLDLVAPASRAGIADILVNAYSRRQQDGLVTMERRDGQERIWHFSAALIEQPDAGPYVLVHSIDITELKRAEATLAANEASLRSLYEIAASADPDFEAKTKELLAVGRRRLGLEHAAVVSLGGTSTHSSSVSRGAGADGALRQLAAAAATAESGTLDQPPAAGLSPGFERCLAAVVRGDGDETVVLVFAGSSGRPWDAHDHQFLSLMAGWLGAELDRQQRRRELALIAELGDLLQSCRDRGEARSVVERQARLLHLAPSGAVYLTSPSRTDLEVAAAWGERLPELAARVFRPEECWALRRGREHLTAQEGDLACFHRPPNPGGATLCLPMAALGDTLGILYLELARPGASPARMALARAFGDQLSLGLANLGLRETLRNQAIRDPLTSLFNRRYLEESLDRELQRAARRNTSVGVIFLDLDHFKRVNDTHGHDAGDMVLQALGHLIRENVRGEDIACRYGGEEFAVILPEAGLEETRARAEKLRTRLRELRLEHAGQPLGPFSLSAGVALYPRHGSRGDLLLTAADQALYEAKAAGRDRVVVAQD